MLLITVPAIHRFLYHLVQTELRILSHNLHRSLYAFLVVRPHNDRVLLLYTYLLLPNIAVVLIMLYINVYLDESEGKNKRFLVFYRKNRRCLTITST